MRTYGNLLAIASLVALLAFAGSASADSAVLSGFTGYGYNNLYGALGEDGQPGAIGCGPTSGAMILNYYFGLSSPLVEARAMGSSPYMDVDAGGFGPASKFGPALEAYAANVHGQEIVQTLHVEPTSYDASGWAGNGYDTADIVTDANFWNTTTWEIDVAAFLAFVKAEIDAGNPLVATVDHDGVDGTDHWMPLVGYNTDTGQWAGYNTWDSSIHWYDVESAFTTSVNAMEIGFLRTIQYLGPIDDTGGGGNDPVVPEPSTLVLLGFGAAGLFVVRLRRKA